MSQEPPKSSFQANTTGTKSTSYAASNTPTMS
eukprot:CAMPEP_0198523372 /NCGR_PEP_ID=MMETSP1462-20131121/22101_1 /TAXON_ID=1333877 /ORGANISM="Brandtodinium nutriculum, Strain RCC3387" /LENGTH=31 /DNA_ID= /DNA_START= /DNA_END= /DNA_ORIENTATION=